jgi:hypothetical protein
VKNKETTEIQPIPHFKNYTHSTLDREKEAETQIYCFACKTKKLLQYNKLLSLCDVVLGIKPHLW